MFFSIAFEEFEGEEIVLGEPPVFYLHLFT